MRVYLDASVILPTLVIEDSSPIVDRFLRRLDQGPVVSDFAVSEVASGISRLVRMGQLRAAAAHEMLSGFDAWLIQEAEQVEVESSDIRASGVFVRRFELRLRTPDAIHVAACKRIGLPLVTLDKRLASAARQLDLEVEFLGAAP